MHHSSGLCIRWIGLDNQNDQNHYLAADSTAAAAAAAALCVGIPLQPPTFEHHRDVEKKSLIATT